MTIPIFIYLLAGIAFGIWFLVRALPGRDGSAIGAGWAFRMMVFPCCVFFWPVLLVLFRNGAGTAMTKGEWRHADQRARRRHAFIWITLPSLLALVVLIALMARNTYNTMP